MNPTASAAALLSRILRPAAFAVVLLVALVDGVPALAVEPDVEAGVAVWLAAANQLFENRPGSGISFSDAASRAKHATGGQVISVAPSEQNGRAGYRVKVLLEDGRVRTLFVDQDSGRVIDPRRGD